MKYLMTLLLSLGFYTTVANAAGRCKPGDVFCGGQCHSSVARCPGNADNDRGGIDRNRGRDRDRDRDQRDRDRRDRDRHDHDRDHGGGGWYPGPGYCSVNTQCTPCYRPYGYAYGNRECRNVDCRGYVVNHWQESCYF